MTVSQRKALQIGEILRVEIEKVAHGGHFIARHEGAVIFIRHAIPGEIVEVEITALDKSFARADVVAVIEASKDRVSPPCTFAGRCGGCDFQHIDLARQRELKSDVIAEQFARIAKMEIEVEVEEVSPPLGWRTRYAANSNHDGEIGFNAIRSNEVIPISHCPILVSEIDIHTLPHDQIGARRRVEVAVDSGGDRSVAVMDIRSDRSAPRSMPQLIEGDSTLNYEVATKFGLNNYQVSQGSFWQSNINAPATLVEAVLEVAGLRSGDHLLDLYGGVGLFAAAALPIVGAGGRVDLIEGNSTATSDAELNCAGAANVKIHTGDVVKALRSFKRADIVILDPPRTGAGRDVLAALARIAPRSIIYVACDPAALARDTGYLREVGYHLQSIRAFDLFPMTHHIESVALYTASEVS